MRSSSCEVIVLWGCLPVRLSSSEVVFLSVHLHMRSNYVQILLNCYFFGLARLKPVEVYPQNFFTFNFSSDDLKHQLVQSQGSTLPSIWLWKRAAL